MKKIYVEGVYKDKKQIFTENLDSAKGIKVYNERIVKRKNKEYRSWNPYRSKLAAAILNNFKFDIKKDYDVLYLGAATGTTVSHISDIVKNGTVYSVEISPISMKKLLEKSKKRQNLIPILANANHTERYSTIVPKVDLIYQDISQKNQTEIFISNVSKFLKNNCHGILVVKARSIDVSLKPEKVYEIVSLKLKKEGFIISDIINLSPYQKDHALIKVRK
jgi:fibrillarin-like pre-rRNA processing protein